MMNFSDFCEKNNFVGFSFGQMRTKLNDENEEKKVMPTYICKKTGKEREAIPPWKDLETTTIKKGDKSFAVKTGEISGISVVDFDNLDTLEEFVNEFPDVDADCFKVRTRSGGVHYYFKYIPEIKTTSNTEKNSCGIDFRNDGGIAYSHGTEVLRYNGEKAYYNFVGGEIMEMPSEVFEWLKSRCEHFVKSEEPVKKTKPKKQLVIEDDEDETTSEEEGEEVEVKVEVKEEKVEMDKMLLEKDKNTLLNLQKCWKSGKLEGYENWRNFTFAIINLLGDDGKEIWRKISKKYKGYNENDNDKKWDEIKKTVKKKSNKFGWGILFDWARTDNPDLFKVLFADFNIDWKRLTDFTFAKNFEDLHFKNKLVFTGKDKELEGYYYNGIYWKDIGINNAEISKGYFSKMYDYYLSKLEKVKRYLSAEEVKSAYSGIKNLDSATGRANIIKVLKQENYKTEIVWNSNLNLFAFEDGIYDLNQGKFIPPTPEQYINITTGYKLGLGKNYELPECKKETEDLNDFLVSITENANVKNFLLIILSSFLKQNNAEEKCYFWLGRGRNGKGTLTDLLKIALGNYFGELSINYWTQYSKGENTPNVNLAGLKYSRLINTSETGEDSNDPNKPIRFITDKFKRITGGDTITTRNLYSNNEIKFQAGKTLIQTNLMPEIVGVEKKENISLRERICIVEFVNSFVSAETKNEPDKINNPYYKIGDKGLKEKFKNNEKYKFALILLLLENYKVYLKNGVKEPTEVQNYKNKYFDDSSKLKNWIFKNLERGEEEDILTTEELIKSATGSVGSLTRKVLFEELESHLGKAKDNKGFGVTIKDGYKILKGYKWIS